MCGWQRRTLTSRLTFLESWELRDVSLSWPIRCRVGPGTLWVWEFENLRLNSMMRLGNLGLGGEEHAVLRDQCFVATCLRAED